MPNRLSRQVAGKLARNNSKYNYGPTYLAMWRGKWRVNDLHVEGKNWVGARHENRVSNFLFA